MKVLASWLAVASILGALLLAAAMPVHPQTAHACMLAPIVDSRIGTWVERSGIVAIGHWESVSAREVTLVVERPLKGVTAGDHVPVDNRTTYTAFMCSPYQEPFREGYRFVPGERAVVVLEQEVDGLWQVGYFALAVFEVPETLDAPMQGMGWFFGDAEAGTPTDVRLRTIFAASGCEEPETVGAALRPLDAGQTGGCPGARTSMTFRPRAEGHAGQQVVGEGGSLGGSLAAAGLGVAVVAWAVHSRLRTR
jgi:hypothetical protein